MAPRLACALALIAASACASRAEGDVPLLTGRVVDNAGLLSPETVSRLTDLLRRHEDSTSNQVAVLTIATLAGEDLDAYSMRVAEAWKLGTRARDNGLILLVVRDDRKVRIEVGRGLEGVLPDITCGLIIRRVIIPRFREGDFDGGITSGVDAILAALHGSYAPPAENASPDLGGTLVGGAIFTVVVGLFTLIVLFARGPQMWFLYFFLIPFWFLFPIAFLGLAAGLIAGGSYALLVPLARLWMSRSSAGKSLHARMSSFPLFAGVASSGWSSGSSSSGGASSWSSGGDFSGGGGGFSGGGASGSW
ncbi:MAG TPA: TPM domain-containing protein [Bacteroidota bacterium]|nr:TPM domain-containing protein [Bacteroidota bacterium]